MYAKYPAAHNSVQIETERREGGREGGRESLTLGALAATLAASEYCP